MKRAVKIFKALSDKNRIRIVKALSVRPLCVCELQKILEISQPSVSHHLKILAEAGIVEYEKDGQWTIYTLNKTPESKTLSDILNNFKGWFEENELVKKDRYILEKLNKFDICQEVNSDEKKNNSNCR